MTNYKGYRIHCLGPDEQDQIRFFAADDSEADFILYLDCTVQTKETTYKNMLKYIDVVVDNGATEDKGKAQKLFEQFIKPLSSELTPKTTVE